MVRPPPPTHIFFLATVVSERTYVHSCPALPPALPYCVSYAEPYGTRQVPWNIQIANSDPANLVALTPSPCASGSLKLVSERFSPRVPNRSSAGDSPSRLLPLRVPPRFQQQGFQQQGFQQQGFQRPPRQGWEKDKPYVTCVTPGLYEVPPAVSYLSPYCTLLPVALLYSCGAVTRWGGAFGRRSILGSTRGSGRW